MILTELTPVPDAALPLDALKDHLQLGSGFTQETLQDEVLRGFLRSALAVIENRTSKMLLQRSFSWVLYEWRSAAKQPLPLAPVQSVVQVQFENDAGGLTQAPEAWTLQQDAQRPLLVATAAALPVIPKGQAAKIEMVAGYGPDWADVPSDLQQAVLMLAAHFYERRAEGDGQGSSMPFGVRSLIEPYRTVRVFMGHS